MQAVVGFGDQPHVQRLWLACQGLKVQGFAPHLLHFFARCAPGGQRRAVTFEQGAQVEYLEQIRIGPVNHHGTAIWSQLDKTLGGQQRQRLAHRGARDTGQGTHLDLADAVTTGKTAAANRFANGGAGGVHAAGGNAPMHGRRSGLRHRCAAFALCNGVAGVRWLCHQRQYSGREKPFALGSDSMNLR